MRPADLSTRAPRCSRRPSPAIASARPPRAFGRGADPFEQALRGATLSALAWLAAGAANGQVAGSLAVQNDYEFRGYSLSDHRPVLMLDLSTEQPVGVYANGSAIGALGAHDEAYWLGWIANAGYARRVVPQVSLDAGVTHFEYREPDARYGSVHYTEAYVGLLTRHLSTHLYYSPDYFTRGASTVYGEVNGGVTAPAQLRLNAHVGYLDYLTQPYPSWRPRMPNQFDWRVGVARRLGPIDLHAAVSGGIADYTPQGPQQLRIGTALVAGASWSF
jgi:uncharacterized protein (TIGR02001 family)